MRPLRLDLAGFALFREPTTVDFTDTDFFALVGPTGSGKSTVLDAVCFALYGTVPRWGSKNAIVNALAPSSTEARVRLVFQSAGDRYVATRVVRRDGKGRVSTAQAWLELLPPGFDVRRFDTGLTPDDLGEVLAGTPGEMDQAVREAVGLPYEQFTTCVVLPQGEFAEFLHAKPATRQQILVNLLGLHVYDRVRERAAVLATAAEAQVQAVERLLAEVSDVDEARLATAAARAAALRELVEQVEATTPALHAARERAAGARESLAAVEAELSLLGAVRPPAGLEVLTGAAATALAGLAGALAAVTAAEEREEKLRGEVAAGPDPAALRRLLDSYGEQDRLRAHAGDLAAAVTVAEDEYARAAGALAAAQAEAARADEALAAAHAAYQAAQAADQAAALRAQLAPGEPCPVCTQPVPVVPPVPAGSAVAAAKAAGQAARKAADATAQVVAERDRAARDLDRTLAAATAQRDQLAARLAEADRRLAGAPAPGVLRGELAAHAALQQRLDEAGAAVRAAREAHRRAQAVQERSAERLRLAWRGFDTARDGVAALVPPPADRDDLASAWAGLAGWAAEQAQRRAAARGERSAAVAEADAQVAAAAAALAGLFTEAGLAPPPRAEADPAGYARAADLAVERAQAEHQRLVERAEQADRLRLQRTEQEREARIAKALATHLRANNFERWLLEEALDLLVEGASRTLRELSGDQYDLGHDKGEFFVIDHHDAGLRRAVRTLSGGETFQASLALALALSEQLAGVSAASAGLESIMLDEGFGTLDAATLDTVAATLENLAARGDRMVGVVTHVAALAERVPVRFEVRKDTRSARIERVGY